MRYRRGVNSLIYAIKTYEYRSSLRKLIRKLRLFFTNENVRKKKLKVLVAFLSDQNWRATRLPPSLLFSQNLPIKTMRKPFSQKKINMQISFYLFALRAPPKPPRARKSLRAIIVTRHCSCVPMSHL